MPQPLSPPSEQPGINALALTEAEQAAREGFDADGNPIEAAPPAEPPAADPAAPAAAPPAAVVEPPVDPAPAATPPAAPAPISSLPDLRVEARDFKAELEQVNGKFSTQLAELKQKYAANELDDDAYEAAREQIIDLRQSERDTLNFERAKFETRQELASEFADHSWQQNVSTFLGQPENAVLLRSKEIQAVWQGSMQAAVNDAAVAGKPLTTDLEIMTAGRDRLFQQLGLTAAAVPPPLPGAAPAPPPPPPPNQAPPVNTLPPSLTGVPAAAPSGSRHTAESLAAHDITELERLMAGMSEAQQDELLRTVPGAFVD